MTLQDQMLAILSELPRTMIGEFDLATVIQRLGDRIAEILDAAGAGVMLEDEAGDLRFVAASDELLGKLEQLQIELGEGPCLYAYQRGAVVITEELPHDDRFPRFAERARDVGMGSVFSFPLEFRGEIVGALNIYDTDPRPLRDGEREAGRTLADVATAYLVNARDVSKYRSANSHLARALDTRIVVEQAKGWVQARTGVDADAAWEAVRHHARSHRLNVHEVARQLLRDELDALALVDEHRRR